MVFGLTRSLVSLLSKNDLSKNQKQTFLLTDWASAFLSRLNWRFIWVLCQASASPPPPQSRVSRVTMPKCHTVNPVLCSVMIQHEHSLTFFLSVVWRSIALKDSNQHYIAWKTHLLVLIFSSVLLCEALTNCVKPIFVWRLSTGIFSPNQRLVVSIKALNTFKLIFSSHSGEVFADQRI